MKKHYATTMMSFVLHLSRLQSLLSQKHSSSCRFPSSFAFRSLHRTNRYFKKSQEMRDIHLYSSLNDENEDTTNDMVHAISVNYHISRECNYACKFCFHTQKNTRIASLEDAKRGLKMLRHEAGTQKINFAGGEPFINDYMLGELCRYSHEELDMAVSIISNGSLIRPFWMELYGKYVDVLGVSIDSFDPQVNAKIGRGEGVGYHGDARRTVKNRHLDRILRVREMCEEQNIKFKMNTVVCNLNWQEDMAKYVMKLSPERWKCFQLLILQDENSGGPNELRNARALTVSREEFDTFVDRHSRHKSLSNILVPEPNDVMQNSYLLLDEDLRFLDCSSGGKVPSESILDVGVLTALQQAGFDEEAFLKRGGIYKWKRQRK